MPAPVYIAPSLSPTYAALVAALTPAAAATDVLTIAGATNRKITVSRIVLSMVATAAAAVTIQVIKRTTLDTGGTSGAVPATLLDPGQNFIASGSPLYQASFASVLAYTVNPGALGTATAPAGGNVWNSILQAGTATAPLPPLIIDFEAMGLTPPVLRLATEQLCVNFSGGTFAGNILAGGFFFNDEGAS